MDKRLYRATEKKLYNYYEKDRRINGINKRIELLKGQIKVIEEKEKGKGILIPLESTAQQYSERVQTSSDGMGYAERTLLNIMEDLEREKAHKERQIAKLEEEIRTIQDTNVIIEYNLQFIGEEDRKFLELKYKEKLKGLEIAAKLYKDDSAVTKQKNRLIEDISRWFDWFSYCNF